MRAASEIDAGAGALDIRDAAGEQHYRSRTRIPVNRHKASFKLKSRAVQLTLPGGFDKRQRADEIRRLGIDLDLQLVNLNADDDLGFRALEFRAKRKGIAVDDERSRRCRIAQHRPADQ